MRYLLVSVVLLAACAAPATTQPTPNPTPTARPLAPAGQPTATPATLPTATPGTSSAPSKPTVRPTISSQVPIGTVTRLNLGITQVHLGVDVAAADEWFDFSLANNQRAMREMIAQQSVFPIADRTRVEVLEHKGLFTLIKVLEGPQADRQGWIRATYVR